MEGKVWREEDERGITAYKTPGARTYLSGGGSIGE